MARLGKALVMTTKVLHSLISCWLERSLVIECRRICRSRFRRVETDVRSSAPRHHCEFNRSGDARKKKASHAPSSFSISTVYFGAVPPCFGTVADPQEDASNETQRRGHGPHARRRHRRGRQRTALIKHCELTEGGVAGCAACDHFVFIMPKNLIQGERGGESLN